MDKLVRGINNFKKYIFPQKRKLFLNPAQDQQPLAIFITCSDSRLMPSLITGTDPGDLFVIRNAGNIIPPNPYGAGEVASIEYALNALNVLNIIVCGHTNCGAMDCLLAPTKDNSSLMPTTKKWLNYANRTLKIIKERHQGYQDESSNTVAAKENVIVQIENLFTYQFIQQKIAEKKLKVWGWMHKLESGETLNYSTQTKQFELIVSNSIDKLEPITASSRLN